MEILTVTKENFEQEVLQAEKPVLVDFWATWCGPCRMYAPILEEFAAEQDGIIVGKVNTDEQPELAEQFGVESIPTSILFKGGKVEKTMVGVQPKSVLEELL